MLAVRSRSVIKTNEPPIFRMRERMQTSSKINYVGAWCGSTFVMHGPNRWVDHCTAVVCC